MEKVIFFGEKANIFDIFHRFLLFKHYYCKIFGRMITFRAILLNYLNFPGFFETIVA